MSTRKALMTEASLKRRLARIKASRLAKLKEWAKAPKGYNALQRHNHAASYLARAKNPILDACALHWRSSRTCFENYNARCDFNPLTGLGHSYGWYVLTQLIRGRLVVNSYTYSCQTSKHRSKVEQTIKALGVRYINVEAPRGLQDLDTALRYATQQWGDAVVAAKYARKPNQRQVRYWARQIDTLRALGAKGTTRRENALPGAEVRRTERLVRLRIKRAERTARHKAHLDAMARITAAGGTGPNSHTGGA